MFYELIECRPYGTDNRLRSRVVLDLVLCYVGIVCPFSVPLPCRTFPQFDEINKKKQSGEMNRCLKQKSIFRFNYTSVLKIRMGTGLSISWINLNFKSIFIFTFQNVDVILSNFFLQFFYSLERRSNRKLHLSGRPGFRRSALPRRPPRQLRLDGGACLQRRRFDGGGSGGDCGRHGGDGRVPGPARRPLRRHQPAIRRLPWLRLLPPQPALGRFSVPGQPALQPPGQSLRPQTRSPLSGRSLTEHNNNNNKPIKHHRKRMTTNCIFPTPPLKTNMFLCARNW